MTNVSGNIGCCVVCWVTLPKMTESMGSWLGSVASAAFAAKPPSSVAGELIKMS